MSIELRDSEISKVWAWVVAHEGPHDVLACCHAGVDGQFHIQWRLATREHEEQPREERKKTFMNLTKPLPESEAEIREEIAGFAQHISNALGCEFVKIIAVEGDVDKAIQMLEDNTEVGELNKRTVH